MGTKRAPAKRQSIYKIPRPLKRVNQAEEKRNPPSTYPDFNRRLQDTCLSLTNCPSCRNLFVLSKTTGSESQTLSYLICGVIPWEKTPTTRAKQLAIISTAIAEDTAQIKCTGNTALDSEMESNSKVVEQDECMRETGPPGNGAGATRPTRNSAHPTHIHGNPENADVNNGIASGNLVAKTLEELEDRWSAKWTKLEAEVMSMKQAQTQGAIDTAACISQTRGQA